MGSQPKKKARGPAKQRQPAPESLVTESEVHMFHNSDWFIM
jgi:hypothetical protein